jgi:hypothetical protein
MLNGAQSTKQGKQPGWQNSDADLVRSNLYARDKSPEHYCELRPSSAGNRVCNLFRAAHQLLNVSNIQLH